MKPFLQPTENGISHSSRFANASKYFCYWPVGDGEKVPKEKENILLAKRPSDVFSASHIDSMFMHLFIYFVALLQRSTQYSYSRTTTQKFLKPVTAVGAIFLLQAP